MQGLSINWFDLMALFALVVGAFVGRKRGLSEELLPVVQWLGMVVISGLFYEPLGRLLSLLTQLTLLPSNILAYLALMVLVGLIFQGIRTLVGDKLVESDVFGKLEYFLGAVAGSVRFACIVVAVLAVLHARYFSPQELAAQAKMQRDNFGNVTFPTFGTIQKDVFARSRSGRFVERYLTQQLISPTAPGTRAVNRIGIAERREKLVDEALGAIEGNQRK